MIILDNHSISQLAYIYYINDTCQYNCRYISDQNVLYSWLRHTGGGLLERFDKQFYSRNELE